MLPSAGVRVGLVHIRDERGPFGAEGEPGADARAAALEAACALRALEAVLPHVDGAARHGEGVPRGHADLVRG
eukprot:scaffold110299_cov69-Phaeocystis_antarctica.AAC.1